MHVWIVFTFGSTLSHSTLNVLGRKWSKHWLGVINWLWSIVLVFSPPPRDCSAVSRHVPVLKHGLRSEVREPLFSIDLGIILHIGVDNVPDRLRDWSGRFRVIRPERWRTTFGDCLTWGIPGERMRCY